MASQRLLGRVSCRMSNFPTSLFRSYFAPRSTLLALPENNVASFARPSHFLGSKSFATAVTPSKPPFFRRVISFVAISIASTAAGFAMATVPALSDANSLVSPLTDADTLKMFSPPDPRSAEIDDFMVNHPIAQALRANPDFSESRPYFKIPEAARSHVLTGGVLSGPGMIWVPPLAFVEKGGKSLTIFYYLGNEISGYPGVVHGGLQATLLDEALARCSFAALPNNISMTANLNINYKSPMPTNSYIVCRAELEKVEGRKAWVKGRLESVAQEGAGPIVYVEASGLFIEPRQAAVSQVANKALNCTDPPVGNEKIVSSSSIIDLINTQEV